VIFIFLGRATDTLIPAVALPLSLLLTFMAMRQFGYSLDNLSLMALTLAIGFLVDDAIVFLENTVRLMERGMKPLEASLESAREISFTILSMTVSLAAVFFPLVFMSGLVGRIFREFAITIVVSIFASGLVSLTLTPLMCARLLKPRGEGVKKNWVERSVGRVEDKVLGVYGKSLWWFLRHRWISALTWIACMAGTVFLFSAVPIVGQSINQTQIRGTITDSSGAVVAGATVIITDVGTNISQSTVSNGHGGYAFTALRPSNYKLVVKAPTFGTVEKDGVTLTVNTNQ